MRRLLRIKGKSRFPFVRNLVVYADPAKIAMYSKPVAKEMVESVMSGNGGLTEEFEKYRSAHPTLRKKGIRNRNAYRIVRKTRIFQKKNDVKFAKKENEEKDMAIAAYMKPERLIEELMRTDLDYLEVVGCVSRLTNVREKMIKSKSRESHPATARFVAAYILRERFRVSYPMIGRMLGGRHHATIIYEHRMMKNYLERLKCEPVVP